MKILNLVYLDVHNQDIKIEATRNGMILILLFFQMLILYLDSNQVYICSEIVLSYLVQWYLLKVYTK